MATPLPKNHARFTLAEIVDATGGRVVREGSVDTGIGVVTDSRLVDAGSIFVALRGDTHDAHAFLGAVTAREPFAVLVSADVELGGACAIVRVDDTLRALGDLAAAHTERLRRGALRTVIGVTGSVGKTSTKEMLALALGHGRPEGTVRATIGNLNNLIGVPMTLLSLGETTELAIIEMGMNVPGEIARLAAIAKPDLGIVTAVAAAHTEGVKSLEAIAEEKSALLRALPASALGAISPADDEVIEPWLKHVAARVLRVGESAQADVRLVSHRVTSRGTELTVALGDESVTFDIPLFGAGAARNATTALAAASLVGGMSRVREAAAALGALVPTAGRLAFVQGTGGTVLLDDSYNASPRAVENALETAAALAQTTQGRLIAVLGDMLELGHLEEELHARVGETVARVGTSLFVACGARMRAAAEEAREMGCDFVIDVVDPLEAIAPVKTFLQRGDVILVKGSRGLRMERVVAALESRGSSPPLSLDSVSLDAEDDEEAA